MSETELNREKAGREEGNQEGSEGDKHCIFYSVPEGLPCGLLPLDPLTVHPLPRQLFLILTRELYAGSFQICEDRSLPNFFTCSEDGAFVELSATLGDHIYPPTSRCPFTRYYLNRLFNS